MLLLALLFFGVTYAQTPEEILKPRTGKQALVSDFTNTLTPDQKQALENKLVQLDDSTSSQVSVVIIETTGGRSISEFNQELGRAWGVGDKRFNNGVVLLIAKKDRELDIAVGYGLE
ncbi:MAG: TPM domain-containing protein, partial [Chitinophagaceae bacterium]